MRFAKGEATTAVKVFVTLEQGWKDLILNCLLKFEEQVAILIVLEQGWKR